MDMVNYPIDVMENDANFGLLVENIQRIRSERASLVEILRSGRIRLSEYAKSSIESLNVI